MTDVAVVLLNNTALGGAERRFAQVYAGLRRRNLAIALVINESLLTALIRAEVIAPGQAALVLKEPFGRLATRLSRYAGSATRVSALLSSLAFWVRKIDYAIACVSVGRWVLRSRPKLLHLVLGGAYVALPLQLLRAAPPAVVSVVCPSLRAMVGARAGLYLYRLALRRARVVDALTDRVRAEVQAEGVAEERVRVSSGSCIDTARFRPASAKRPWVVFAGRLVAEKNPALFVQASAMVHQRFPSARFFVLGAGPLQGEIEELIRQLDLTTCTDIGWRDRVESVLSEALIFVSLQRTDNYPSQAVLEAMACGTAVVATDVGLTFNLVDDTVGCRVTPTATAVADAVSRLLASPEQAVLMGQRARQRVMQQHSMEAYLDYLVSLYAQASGVTARETKGCLVSART